ncbi:RNA polymerase sigma-70 factor, ECF subfamily [Dyadobacter koreensis]|uniref:RNA polymerase sigma-70 factor, ECF subfamily n=1 Tax=Dyadobacter koreensis TaxID=408657 RepID=A0A1H6UVU3_9BACT|nr:sigma-70 family RNA polymerase sigma factor [Dyadobacter koreensis]SEI92082.1 RNA polymerase sigma-70 factor, ECF subfamily [Dyadobacter koreensis]
MEEKELLPHLFRTEYQKMVSVLCYTFGIEHIEVAQDIVSDTFLSATEVWSIKGIPENPPAWLYTVAKNKTKNYLKRDSLFEKKISEEIRYTTLASEQIEIDMSQKNIADSQLAMIFTVCDPSISNESQIALALNLLCGFGIQEIADAFLTNKEVVYKRINRAKEKLKEAKIKIEQPSKLAINMRLETVLTTLYLLFSEGYYSISQNTVLRKDLCAEAMRLNYLLVENEDTNQPQVNALLALMCFHASRFEARTDDNGELVLYEDQDESRWDRKLMERGEYFLNEAASGDKLTKFHLEAGIAYWHTHKEDTPEKWENILDLYNHLLILEYSPIAALNRTFALAKTNGKEQAILEAEKLNLTTNLFYHSLLGNLYSDLDDKKALAHFEMAIVLAHSSSDKSLILKNIKRLKKEG